MIIIRFYLLTKLFIISACLSLCYGQGSASFKLMRWSISDGGGEISSARFQLKESAIGGFAVGISLSSNFSLNGGMLITKLRDLHLAKETLPQFFQLLQNYPNPFNPETKIEYDMPKATEVTIQIFNNLGQRVRTLLYEYQLPGKHWIHWDGKDDQGQQLPTGNYYYQIITDGFRDVRKMLLLK